MKHLPVCFSRAQWQYGSVMPYSSFLCRFFFSLFSFHNFFSLEWKNVEVMEICKMFYSVGFSQVFKTKFVFLSLNLKLIFVSIQSSINHGCIRSKVLFGFSLWASWWVLPSRCGRKHGTCPRRACNARGKPVLQKYMLQHRLTPHLW